MLLSHLLSYLLSYLKAQAENPGEIIEKSEIEVYKLQIERKSGSILRRERVCLRSELILFCLDHKNVYFQKSSNGQKGQGFSEVS